MDKNIDIIREIYITGGEPSLNGESVEYIVNKVIEKDNKNKEYEKINGFVMPNALIRPYGRGVNYSSSTKSLD